MKFEQILSLCIICADLLMALYGKIILLLFFLIIHLTLFASQMKYVVQQWALQKNNFLILDIFKGNLAISENHPCSIVIRQLWPVWPSLWQPKLLRVSAIQSYKKWQFWSHAWRQKTNMQRLFIILVDKCKLHYTQLILFE